MTWAVLTTKSVVNRKEYKSLLALKIMRLIARRGEKEAALDLADNQEDRNYPKAEIWMGEPEEGQTLRTILGMQEVQNRVLDLDPLKVPLRPLTRKQQAEMEDQTLADFLAEMGEPM